ncbi:hypothetical protein D8I30_08210 [Brevundimonas naejangsanensis]|uniref:Sel1 repeat family protein n=1 Tax=Brevundimonas naejangsanensis TaxID=588932 RepID=A0A494RP27_9CAUL|nr:hypothetical protein [Brevundimonas naejangsanensis]AYG95166.1 hypothetical protein D8I30_08210 [Brevundimonas naejangsanensis]
MLLVAFTAALALGPAQANRLVSYDEAVRCAGLTQAASELEGGESRYGRQLYDAALYWSLAAMQAATTAGRDPTAAEDDQTRARLQSVRRLSAGDAEARSALQRCRQKAPRLD